MTVRRLTTHRILTPLMVIEGRVQYLLAIARLVPTRKLASQFLPLALRLMGMGGPTPGCFPPAKVGHLTCNLTVAHLAPVAFLSFPRITTDSMPSKSWSSHWQSYTSGTPSHSFLSLVSPPDSTPEEGFFSIRCCCSPSTVQSLGKCANLCLVFFLCRAFVPD